MFPHGLKAPNQLQFSRTGWIVSTRLPQSTTPQAANRNDRDNAKKSPSQQHDLSILTAVPIHLKH